MFLLFVKTKKLLMSNKLLSFFLLIFTSKYMSTLSWTSCFVKRCPTHQAADLLVATTWYFSPESHLECNSLSSKNHVLFSELFLLRDTLYSQAIKIKVILMLWLTLFPPFSFFGGNSRSFPSPEAIPVMILLLFIALTNDWQHVHPTPLFFDLSNSHNNWLQVSLVCFPSFSWYSLY